jgi:hypothetical protein
MVTSVRRVVSLVLAALLAAATAVAIAPPGGVSPAGAQAAPPFYTPPSPLPAGRNGDVIRSEAISYVGAARASRIMYLSRDVRDRPMAVTGTVLVPTAAWTGAGPRPIVAYAPFTAGMGDQCAVSRIIGGEPGDLVSGVQTAFVNNLLQRGIAVAQTDYQGLGTPGDHTYVMRRPQAQATLDVIRAAQRLPATGLPAAGPVGIAGYSQGGGASAAAVELAPTYAPELNIQGAYVGAPAADLAGLATSLDGSFYAGFLAFALIGIDAAYDEVDLTVLANAAGNQLLNEARTVCTFDAVLRYAFRQTSTLTVTGTPVRDFLGVDPFRRIVSENRVGTLRPTAPVLIEHSSLDDVLPVAQGRQLGRDWCSRGATNVQFRDIPVFLPFLVHISAANSSAVNAATWLQGRFTGTPATGNCSAI